MDYEGESEFLSLSFLRSVLKVVKNGFILTFAVRGREFQGLYKLQKYLELMNAHPKFSFCVVAGHPVYESVDREINVEWGFSNFLEQIRERSSRPVFVGGENIPLRVITGLNDEFGNIVPFFLNGDSRITGNNELSRPIAVYSPLAESKMDAVHDLTGYLLRRKRTQRELGGMEIDHRTRWTNLPFQAQAVLKKNVDRFVLTLNGNLGNMLTEFSKNNVRYMIGHPSGNPSEMIKGFAASIQGLEMFYLNNEFYASL
ncbi:MAG: hypothetical protein ACXAEU_00560 [Candidatus Hodarchaeales archaeon]